MTSTFEHYEKHLAPIYSWMVGDFESACQLQQQFFESLNLSTDHSRIAVDLGCGHGIQAIPLARLGFHVVAIDTSQHLLLELRQWITDQSIVPIQGDLRKFPDHLDDRAAVIVCMGDTLTHLENISDVHQLISNAKQCLVDGGILCLSFRDYTSATPGGVDRFIPVRADENRIHTCFLEYHAATVIVHDIIHQRSDDVWKMSVSCYPKLRLSPDELVHFAESQGFEVFHRSEIRGMNYFGFRLTS